MNRAIADIEFLTPYCQCRYHEAPALKKEIKDDYEKRTWRSKLHESEINPGMVVIPSMAFSNCLKEAVGFVGTQVPGKGKTTWTKHFQAGVCVLDDVETGRSIESAIEKKLFVPSSPGGKPGVGSRVMKSFPLLLPPLSVSVEFFISNDLITPEVFAYHLQQAGQLIGLGSFRIRLGGMFGKFRVNGIEWIEDGAEAELPPITIREAK
jgi:hypothetical protein